MLPIRSNKGWSSSTLGKYGPSGVLPQYKIFHEQRTNSLSYCKQNLTVWPERCAKSKYRSVPSPQPFVWGEGGGRGGMTSESPWETVGPPRSVIYFTSWLDVWSLTWFFKNRQPPGRSSMIVRWDFQAYSLKIESCCASYRSEVGQENSGLIGSRRYMLWLGRKGTFL